MIRRAALAGLVLALSACGKQTFLVAAFVQTPALPNPQDPNGTIPSFQVLTAYFGTIDTSNPTRIDASREQAIADATATLAFRHVGTSASDASEDRVLAVPAAANAGNYSLSSKDNPKLTFEAGVPYTLVLLTAGADGEAFGARFVPGPAADIKQFQGAQCQVALPAPAAGNYAAPRCIDNHGVSAPLTIDRTDTAAPGQDLSPAFVLVGKIDPQNPAAEPQVTYKTVPDTADKLLRYVLSDRSYRVPTFTIDGSAFPAPGYYLVSLLTAKSGKVSGNAFLGSTALAASGAAGIVHVP